MSNQYQSINNAIRGYAPLVTPVVTPLPSQSPPIRTNITNQSVLFDHKRSPNTYAPSDEKSPEYKKKLSEFQRRQSRTRHHPGRGDNRTRIGRLFGKKTELSPTDNDYFCKCWDTQSGGGNSLLQKLKKLLPGSTTKKRKRKNTATKKKKTATKKKKTVKRKPATKKKKTVKRKPTTKKKTIKRKSATKKK